MATESKRIAMIVKDYFEQVEMTDVRELLQDAGFMVDLIAPEMGEVQGLNHVDKGDVFEVDRALDDITTAEYDAIVLPGGVVNADQLRVVPKACDFVRQMDGEGKTVAAICHAPWVLISAGVAEGHTLTSYATLQDDVRNAGATWVDQAVVIDDNIITSRKPDDIPAFSQAIINELNA